MSSRQPFDLAPVALDQIDLVTNPSTDHLIVSNRRTLCDHSVKVIMLSDQRLEGMNHLAIRRAVSVASASLQTKISQYTSFDEKCIQLACQKVELDACLLESELIFLDKLKAMNEEEVIDTLFELFDKDGSGTVDIRELAEGLRKLNKMTALNATLKLAEKTISDFDDSVDGLLNKEEFSVFLYSLKSAIGCSFDDLAQLMVMRLAFAVGGNKILEESVDDLINTDKCHVTSIASFNDAVNEARMILIFLMLDFEQTGIICFNFVVKHIFKFSHGMEELKRQLLLAMDPTQYRPLNYEQFSELMLNLIAAFSRNVDFDDVANAMTLSVARSDLTDEDMKELFVSSDIVEHVYTLGITGGNRNSMSFNDLVNGRLQRLFNLVDSDHNSFVDTDELTICLMKFQQTCMDVDAAMSEALSLIHSFDRNHDQRLNYKEFSSLLLAFASAADVSVHELIDFMVVQVSLKDDDAKAQAYINSLKTLKSVRKSSKRGKDILKKRVNILNLLHLSQQHEPESAQIA